MIEHDTIAAISTPVMRGGIGIIRLSGEKSSQIAEKIFNVTLSESHTIRYGFIFDSKTGDVIDEALVTYMKAPKTYTREDIVEINCHSGIAVLNKIMSVLLDNGVRQAEPGEFTKRAFLNGRVDLTRAEAVIDIINAKTEISRRSAASQLSGRLFVSIKGYMDRLLLCLANIEAEIDYPEHFEDGEQSFFLEENVDRLLSDARALYETSERGRIIKEGINTAIIGETNVGKSSLLNYFAGCERAIVTDIHGTTRDTLEESVNLNGALLKITDTAGIRETDDPVEKIGVERAMEAAKEADLILYVIDASCELSRFIITTDDTSAQIIALVNKSDLPAKADMERIRSVFGADNVLNISVKTGGGLPLLESKIREMFFAGILENADEPVISSLRHKEALKRCILSLEKCKETLANGFPPDIVSIDLMGAYAALGEITGESIDENLVDKIFSEFCLGK